MHLILRHPVKNSMAGKRLVDLAALFNASRGVAEKHIALRARQLDVYNRTSTLAKAVRHQTDRVTETAKAAAFFASRLNESAPSWTVDDPSEAEQKSKPNNGRPDSTPQPSADSASTDHFHEASAVDSVTNITKDAQAHTIEDAIPHSQETDARRPNSQINSETFPSPTDLPKTESTPSSEASGEVGQTNTSKGTIFPTQETDPRHPDNQINSETFPSPAELSNINSTDEVPEGINTALFHSRRVAGMLGGRTQNGIRGELKPKFDGSLFSQIRVEQPQSDRDSHAARTDQASQEAPKVDTSSAESTTSPTGTIDARDPSISEIAEAIAQESEKVVSPDIGPNTVPYELRESRVPSSRLGRLWNYGGLAAGMVGGALSESLRRVTGSGGVGSYFLSENNVERLVTKLSRMRGAALKLGQMISIQDSKMLPPQIQEVLQRVQDRADYMPPSQRNKVLVSDLGADWRDLFSSFEEKPMAAASIGQVHSAVLKSNGQRVAVKIQYPGVADSIDSDLSNLAILLTASRLLPKGLFLDKTLANARTELAWECDYIREAECARRFQEFLADETDTFVVPKVYPEASGKQVLTMEYMDGIGVTRKQGFTQEQRDWIGTQILRLCLREITEFRYMQTDPNWTNFLFNSDTQKLELLDFGASREYPEEFIDKYTRLLEAASRSDKKQVIELSVQLGYLTGEESKAMRDAHVTSVLTLAEPFMQSAPEVYDFKDQTITERVKSLIPVMIRERLSPPPEETYSLHRKLSGAFLLCARLGSRVRCRELFVDSIDKFGIHQRV